MVPRVLCQHPALACSPRAENAATVEVLFKDPGDDVEAVVDMKVGRIELDAANCQHLVCSLVAFLRWGF